VLYTYGTVVLNVPFNILFRDDVASQSRDVHPVTSNKIIR